MIGACAGIVRIYQMRIQMIPQEQRRKALMMTLVSFGLMAIGIALGLYWVSIYMPK